MINIAILASHNGSGYDTLRQACENNILNVNIKLIISNNTNAPVLKKAKKYGVDNYLVNSKTCEDVDARIYSLLQEYNCDYICLFGYMKKISSKITQNFKVINSHPSLLPKHGGVGMYGSLVHEAVIKNKDKKSGVTVHEVNANYDDGKIILQKELILSENETAQTLEIKIKELEKTAIVEGILKCLK